jgi:hypothetical protein
MYNRIGIRLAYAKRLCFAMSFPPPPSVAASFLKRDEIETAIALSSKNSFTTETPRHGVSKSRYLRSIFGIGD